MNFLFIIILITFLEPKFPLLFKKAVCFTFEASKCFINKKTESRFFKMCDFVKIKKTNKIDFVEFQLNMSTAAGRGEQTTKATLNCVFLSLSEGKVEKGNEKSLSERSFFVF